MKYILLSLLLAVPAAAQTTPTPTQINWPTASEPMLVAVLPTGLVFVKLDPATVMYDSASRTIKAMPAVFPEITFADELLAPVAGVWRTAPGCALVGLFRNGIKQHAIAISPTLPDFDLTGTPDGVVTIAWRPTSTPAALDVVSVTCARQAAR